MQRLVLAALLVTLLSGTALAQQGPPQRTVLPGHQMQLQKNSHGLGLTGGYGGANGFAYRKYIGNNFVQISALPLMADRGDFLALMFGASFGRYLIVWHRQRSASLMPTTTALRAVGLASTWFSRDASSFVDAAPCAGVNCTSTPAQEAKVENTTTLAAGVGFEFGGVLRNGFSLSVDLLLTSVWDEEGFDMLVPLPYGALVYSW